MNLTNLSDKAKPFLDRIEALHSDRESVRGEAMAKCRAISDNIKEVYVDAKLSGIQTGPLKATVKLRRLQGQIAALPSQFEDNGEAAQYQELSNAFGDLPFGRWARGEDPLTWTEPPRKRKGAAKAAELAEAN
jgi:uncharacterized protein (UPF0335 family)